jgi:soluble lytic murein transglycosylase
MENGEKMKLTVKQWVLVVCLFLLFFLLNSQQFWKLMYPIQYVDEVSEAVERFQVDPFLVLAVVQIESNFKHERFSNKGATGLMQLMPDTAHWANKESGLNKDPQSYIHDPKANILLGSWYLSYLIHKYEGNYTKAVVAYNAGQGNVDRWLQEGVWDGTEASINQIPFGETRHYVARVMYFYHRYHSIYQEDF